MNNGPENPQRQPRQTRQRQKAREKNPARVRALRTVIRPARTVWRVATAPINRGAAVVAPLAGTAWGVFNHTATMPLQQLAGRAVVNGTFWGLVAGVTYGVGRYLWNRFGDEVLEAARDDDEDEGSDMEADAEEQQPAPAQPAPQQVLPQQPALQLPAPAPDAQQGGGQKRSREMAELEQVEERAVKPRMDDAPVPALPQQVVAQQPAAQQPVIQQPAPQPIVPQFAGAQAQPPVQRFAFDFNFTVNGAPMAAPSTVTPTSDPSSTSPTKKGAKRKK